MEKELEMRFNSKEDLRKQEKMVYASLSKILFDVQQLHVSLSGTCVDSNCIENAVNKFDSSITKYHEEISNNLLYMSSEVINLIYSFYNRIGELKLELKEMNQSKNFSLAHVSVHHYSKELATIVIDIQDLFISQRSDLRIQFDKTKQEMMKYCCGQTPPDDVIKKYHDLKATMVSTYGEGMEVTL